MSRYHHVFVCALFFFVSAIGLSAELTLIHLTVEILGESVKQFSVLTGIYLLSMGAGSYIVGYLKEEPAILFLKSTLFLSFCSAVAPYLLGVSDVLGLSVQGASLFLALMSGVPYGMLIPLGVKLIKVNKTLDGAVVQLSSLDYFGALVGSLFFPFVLFPYFQLQKGSFLNASLFLVVAFVYYFFISSPGKVVYRYFLAMNAAVVACSIFFYPHYRAWQEDKKYGGEVIMSVASPYQRLVLTRFQGGIHFYINGGLQFSSHDEFIYHEAMVHPAMLSLNNPRKVLILGGGDGLALREVLKWSQVESITLVDLDPIVTKTFKVNSHLRKINENAFDSPKVKVVNSDAYTWVRTKRETFDAVFVDFPDPHSFGVGKLYTQIFYKELKKRVSPGGVVVVQSTSPYVSTHSFWSIVNTIGSSGFQVMPYHITLSTFGKWGFTMAFLTRESRQRFSDSLPRGFPKLLALHDRLRFLNAPTLEKMFVWPNDLKTTRVFVNRLNTQRLVHTYEKEWSQYLSGR